MDWTIPAAEPPPTILPCECIVTSVADVERLGRPFTSRALEWLLFAASVAASRLLGVSIRDFSLGRYQIRLSTAARLVGIELQRKGRAIERNQAGVVVGLARAIAGPLGPIGLRHRIGEALYYGQRDQLTIVRAVARSYAGELAHVGLGPYGSQLCSVLAARVIRCPRSCEFKTR